MGNHTHSVYRTSQWEKHAHSEVIARAQFGSFCVTRLTLVCVLELDHTMPTCSGHYKVQHYKVQPYKVQHYKVQHYTTMPISPP